MSRLVALAAWLVALVALRREQPASDEWPGESWELNESTLGGFVQVCGQLGASEQQLEEFRQGWVAEEQNLRGMQARLEENSQVVSISVIRSSTPIRRPRERRVRTPRQARAPDRPDRPRRVVDLDRFEAAA